MRRYLAFWPDEVPRVYRLLQAASEGSAGHGPAHLLLESAAEIGFFWCSRFPGWDRPGLPVLSMVDGPIQHFRAAILDAWRHKVSMGLCARKGFRGGPFLDVSGTLQLLNSDHVRERDKALLRGVLVGGVWNGFFIGKRLSTVMCRVGFVVGMIMMVICFGNALFHLWWRFVKILNFTNSWRWISRFGLDACFGMVGCLCFLVPIWVLLGLRIFLRVLAICWRVLWVLTPLLLYLIGVCLLVLMLRFAALQVAQEPDVWTDGSRTEDKLSSVSSSGAGFSTGLSSRFWAECSWVHVDSDVQGDLAVASCRGSCSVPGPLQSVQRG